MDYLKGVKPMSWRENPQYEVDANGNIISHGKVIIGTRFVYKDGRIVISSPRPLEVIAWHNEQIRNGTHYVMDEKGNKVPSGIVKVEAIFKE